MRRRFVTLDVFTNRRFAGNPLAVVLDAERLDTVAMQVIAHEFNHPETVFIFPPSDPAHRARVRIFTPRRELPFAGHPTVGTAVLLGLRDGGVMGHEIVLEEGIGPVRCSLERTTDDAGRASFSIPQLPAEVEPVPDDAILALALGVTAADIGEFRPARWSAGMPFTFVPLTSRAAVERCRPDPASFDSAFGAGGAAYVVCRQTVEPGHSFHARMFAPGMGIPEDPATGFSGRCVCRLAGVALVRWNTSRHHRAGLRDGTAEPDAAGRGGRGWANSLRFDRRRRRRRDRGNDRGMSPSDWSLPRSLLKAFGNRA
jgi:trans-2,3-dihydro-3-hydroxyanthranilate isomerase